MVARLLLAAVILNLAPLACAATLTWPTLSGSGPCTGTLQACIDGAAAGDTVLIGADEAFLPDPYTAINEPIRLGKSLTLGAKPGIDAVVGAGFNVIFEPEVPGPHQVTIAGLVFRRGSVDIRDTGTAAGSVFRVERVRIVEPALTNAVSCAINFQLSSPSPQIIAGDNVIHSGSAANELRSGICAYASATTAYNASVFRNRVVSEIATLRFGIVLVASDSGGSIKVSANTVLGPRLVEGIVVQRASGVAAQSVQIDNNAVSLQSDTAGWGINVQGGNSSVAIANNTVAHGARGMLITGIGTLPVSGRVASNLVAFHSGLGIALATEGLSNSHNLVFGNASNSFTPGPSTLTADPLLVSAAHPRLANGSPAIDAGSTADLPPLTLFDADGERRTAFGTVDIGAYEATGDAAARITASSATRVGNEVYVTPFPVSLSAVDTLVAVARHAAWPQGASSRNLGVYASSSSPSGWSLFLQQFSLSIPLDAAFHVLAPFAGKTGFVHQTAAANISGALTTIDNAALNGAANRSRIAIPFHHWQGTYHDFPIGLRWVSTAGGRWQVRNEDGTAMVAGQTFNLAVAPAFSPNAFRATLSNFANTQWRLEHPLLDGNPCAAPIVGRVDDPDVTGDLNNPTAFGVAYAPASGPGAPGRWVVRADAESGSPTFPAGSSFNVIIDGDQANGCRAPVPDRLFANGFE